MIIRYFAIIAVLFLFSATAWGGDTKTEFTQKDFAQLILSHFSWSAGLPAEPTDRDYLLILGGKRTFRFEAENAYNEKTDLVTMREFNIFGPFTGKGWIFGVSDTTSATFTVLLPIEGEYTLKSVIKGNGFVWKIDNKDYRVDSNSGNFREVEVNKITLKAGIQTINVSIPPDGAIDSFSFTAADLAPIQPLIGWRFKEQLTAGRMAEIFLAMASLYSKLPDSQDNSVKSVPVFEVAQIPATAARTSVAYLGRFTSREWIRADYRGAGIQIPVKIVDTGFYTVTGNVMGEKIKGSINQNPFEVKGKPYLDRIDLGLYRLESGDNMITIELPPMGGVDSLEFRKKSASPDDLLKLAGIKGPAERPIPADEAGAFLKSIQAAYSARK